MRANEVFRPNPLGTFLGVFLLPVLTILTAVPAVVMLLGSPGIAGVLWFLLFAAVACLFGVPAYLILRGWFAIDIDETALSMVGLFNTHRMRMPWSDLDGVGLVKWRGARFLSVRPVDGWDTDAKPRRWGMKWAMRWDPNRRLLLIAGVDNWSRPSEELLGCVREYAGTKWHDPLDEPLAD
ncbi:hypothetical protein ABZV93_04680 [Actinopolymorpha sp. NPDC004070]|uniref:hypothetical protein n=1 Tax=Actinopolymorpha sp. NPDC004070 TaxID=3154548 RepID=UPI0033A270DA